MAQPMAKPEGQGRKMYRTLPDANLRNLPAFCPSSLFRNGQKEDAAS